MNKLGIDKIPAHRDAQLSQSTTLVVIIYPSEDTTDECRGLGGSDK